MLAIDLDGDGCIADAGELGSLAEAGVDHLDGATLARQTLVFVPRRQTAAHFTQTKNRSGLAGFHIHLSAYIHRHIAPNRRSRYHFPLSAKTRHQAGSGHPMAVRRVA